MHCNNAPIWWCRTFYFAKIWSKMFFSAQISINFASKFAWCDTMRALSRNCLRLSCCAKKTTVSNTTHSTEENYIFPNNLNTESLLLFWLCGELNAVDFLSPTRLHQTPNFVNDIGSPPRALWQYPNSVCRENLLFGDDEFRFISIKCQLITENNNLIRCVEAFTNFWQKFQTKTI